MNTKTMKPAYPLPCCAACGSTNIETTAWIDYRPDGTDRVVNTEVPFSGNEGNYCHDCDDHVDLDYPNTTPAQDRDRQQNNAAREHGPELLDALSSVMTLAHSHFLLKGKTASSSDMAAFTKAKQLIELLTKNVP